jgi:Asp-tRNA(Asn)/Glu-tRNA(Gln) amidotransferase A subunit family amidase
MPLDALRRSRAGGDVTNQTGTITNLARAVRERRVSASALVSASIERLESAAALNVLAEAIFDEALDAATRIDRGESEGGLLLGVPTLIKDLEDLAGHQTRKGSLALRDVTPAGENGVVPGRLLRAGAVVVGKSTLPEFAIEGYTANLLTGVTRNPWNLDYSPGGSSGGSAAAVAAGLVGVATATDGGGSVRIPASLCGLVGLKPTNGAVGRWPAPDWIDYSTDGPFATSSEDLRLLFRVMQGPAAGDPTSPPVLAPANVPARHLLAAERTSPFGPLSPAVTNLFRDAVAAFAARFCLPVTWLDQSSVFDEGDPDLDWFTVTSPEHVSSFGRDWVREHMDEFHVATREFLGTGLEVTIDDYLAARRRRYLYVRRIDELLEGGGLLLTPTVAAEGWLADGRMNDAAELHGLAPEVYSTALQNITGHPALTVPFGHLPSGLPFGLQITAEHYRDQALLDVAAIFEREHPWRRTAPGYETLDSVLDLG